MPSPNFGRLKNIETRGNLDGFWWPGLCWQAAPGADHPGRSIRRDWVDHHLPPYDVRCGHQACARAGRAHARQRPAPAQHGYDRQDRHPPSRAAWQAPRDAQADRDGTNQSGDFGVSGIGGAGAGVNPQPLPRHLGEVSAKPTEGACLDPQPRHCEQRGNSRLLCSNWIAASQELLAMTILLRLNNWRSRLCRFPCERRTRLFDHVLCCFGAVAV